MCFGGGSVSAPAPAAPAPEAPVASDARVQGAGADALLRAKAAGGLSSTILTGPMGLSDPATSTTKTLLGA